MEFDALEIAERLFLGCRSATKSSFDFWERLTQWEMATPNGRCWGIRVISLLLTVLVLKGFSMP